MKTTKLAQKLKITINRPSGKIDIVYKTDSVRFLGTNNAAQQQCVKANREAGRGDIQSFEIVDEQVPMSLDEQRQDLVWDINGLIGAQDAARERDFDNDIGFHESVKFDSKIEALRDELTEFDAAHPEIIGEIKRQQGIKSEELIQSALNA